MLGDCCVKMGRAVSNNNSKTIALPQPGAAGTASVVRYILVLGSLAVLTIPARADPTSNPARLPPLIVRGAAQDSAHRLSGTTTVKRSDLETSAKSDLDKVLRGLLGVTLLRNTRGALSAFSLRGANGGQGQFLLDGIPLYGTLTGTYNLDGFAPELLEDVEVERGAAGIRHGGQALGGVVRLHSRDEHETGARLHVQGGSFGTLAETATASLAGSGARATLTARHEDIFDGVSQADSRNGNAERDGYRSNFSLFRYLAEPADGLDLDGTFYYGFNHAEIDGFGFTPQGRPGWMDDEDAFGRTETWLAQQSGRVTLTPGWESGLQLGWHRTQPHVRVRGIDVESDSQLLMLRWRNVHEISTPQFPEETFRFVWGADARTEEGRALGPTGRVSGQRGQIAGFADLEAAHGPWSGAAGIRFDHYDENSAHGTYYLGLGFQAAPSLALRASGGRGYRIPSFHERHFPFFGNPTLQPESADSGQVGFDWTPLPGARFSATGFYHRYENLIRVSFEPAIGFFRVANVPRAEVGGVELEAAYEFQPFAVGVNYTLQESEDRDTGRNLARLPHHLGKLFGEWKPDGLPVVLGAEILYREGYADDNGGTLRMGDAWTVNAQAAYTAASWLQFYVRGENLSDDRTPDDFSFGKPGAAVYGGVRLAFG